jgi:hypothetical protein
MDTFSRNSLTLFVINLNMVFRRHDGIWKKKRSWPNFRYGFHLNMKMFTYGNHNIYHGSIKLLLIIYMFFMLKVFLCWMIPVKNMFKEIFPLSISVEYSRKVFYPKYKYIQRNPWVFPLADTLKYRRWCFASGLWLWGRRRPCPWWTVVKRDLQHVAVDTAPSGSEQYSWIAVLTPRDRNHAWLVAFPVGRGMNTRRICILLCCMRKWNHRRQGSRTGLPSSAARSRPTRW